MVQKSFWIQPVPKKGDLTKIKNYRPISLAEVPRKLFLEPLSIEQGGFRAGRGTLDQAGVLQEWLLQAMAAKQQRLMAFLDIKAACDSVDRTKLWQKCLQRGLPENIVGLLRGLFDHNRAYIAIAGRESTGFELGSLLSPLLYSVFIDDLVSLLNAEGHEDVVMHGRSFRCLLYADDIVLMATRPAVLHDMLRLCEAHSLINRYRFNTSKCEIMATLPLKMQIYSDPGEDTALIPQVAVFNYLGYREDRLESSSEHRFISGQRWLHWQWLWHSCWADCLWVNGPANHGIWYGSRAWL